MADPYARASLGRYLQMMDPPRPELSHDEAERLSLERYLMSAPSVAVMPQHQPGMSHKAGTSHYEKMSETGRAGLNYMTLGIPHAIREGQSVGDYALASLGGLALMFDPILPRRTAAEMRVEAAQNPYAAATVPALALGPLVRGASAALQGVGQIPKTLSLAGALMFGDGAQNQLNMDEVLRERQGRQ